MGITIDANGFVGNPTCTGDCDSYLDNSLCDLFTPLTVTVDLDGTARTVPWKGVYEKGNGPLPVELLFFKAICEKEAVNLYWATASETNNDFFTIERAIEENGILESWVVVGIIDGAGTINMLKNYNFIDKDIDLANQSSQVYYYRLKQTDFDGKYQYSNIITVKCDSDNMPEITVFPNPVSDSQFFVFVNGVQKNNNIEITITDIAGKKVFSDNYLNTANSCLLPVKTKEELKAGIYFVIVQTENSKKMVSKLIVK